ncbi:site-2 protease family protein, partial [Myxococcota bacterium]|nr:site-2 protease family protein [Myxococcota bacterium]
HRALKTGWESFVEMLILISVNIGILNMLPIPVLDGGQALMYSVEGLSRGKLSKQARGLFQQFGMIFLLAIMAFAFWNDISRNWSTFFDWLTGF